MAIWSRLTGGIASFGVGAAAADAISPVLEGAKQQARGQRAIVVLAPAVAADAEQRRFDVEIDGTGKAAVFRSLGDDGKVIEESTWPVIEIDFEDDAKRSAVGQRRYLALRRMMQRLPSSAEMLELWRRSRIDQATFDSALAHAAIPPSLWPAIRALKLRLLDPGQLAAAIHRGLIPDPGLLKGEQPEKPFNVEPYPVYPIAAVPEAAGFGYDKDRLGVLVGLQGLPMGVIEAAQAYFRGILTKGDYIRAFNESNNRNEWAESVLKYARQIPTARDFFENALRGYHSLEWAQKQAERHGMDPDDSLVIYQNQGRPMNIRQITQALSRGGVFEPEPGELTDPYDASVVEGNIKPAYYKLAKALKYTLPSPFVMRSMAQTRVWSEKKTAQRLRDIGWIPEDATEAAAEWSKGTAAKADPYVSKAETQLWGTLHRSYIAGESDEATAVSTLDVLGLDEAAKSAVVGLWTNERELTRKQLTPAQLKKAWTGARVNPLTSAPWTRDEVLTALLSRGWNAQDANTFLEL